MSASWNSNYDNNEEEEGDDGIVTEAQEVGY